MSNEKTNEYERKSVSPEPQAEKVYSLIEGTPRAIVIHCSDPRFQMAFREFIHNELRLQDGEYVPLVISGGVASLAEPLKLPKEFKFLKERIELFLERFDSIDRLILINHQDCRHYDALKSAIGNLFLHRFAQMSDRQKSDLRAVGKMLLGLASSRLRINLYFARMTGGDHPKVVFDEIMG